MIKFKKPFAIKMISILLSILFLCNASLCAYPVSKDFLRVPIGDYERLQETAKVAYIEDKTQEKLSKIEEGLNNILQNRKQPLSDWTRDKVIRLSMLPLINKITSGLLRNLGDKPSLRRNLFFVMPFVKWLCKRFLLTVDIEDEAKFEPEMKKVVAFVKDKHGKGMSVSLDNVGDAALSEESAENYKQFYVKVINYLGKRDDIEEINLSFKFSALCYEFAKVTESGQRDIKIMRVKKALRDILSAASSIEGKKIFIRIDMEEYVFRDITIDIFKEVIEENPNLAIDREGNLKLGLVIQGYLRDSEGVLSGLLDWAKKMKYRVPVRLVKGAYDKYEKEEARKRGDKSPVFDYKVSTDTNYELLSEFLIVHREYFRPVFATHNIRSIARVMALAEYYGLEKSELEFQMLLGMGDEIKQAIVGMGYRIREYVPSGALARGLKYSGRRFAELCNKDNALTRTLKGDYRHLKEKPQFAEGDLPAAQWLTAKVDTLIEAGNLSPNLVTFAENYRLDETAIGTLKELEATLVFRSTNAEFSASALERERYIEQLRKFRENPVTYLMEYLNENRQMFLRWVEEEADQYREATEVMPIYKRRRWNQALLWDDVTKLRMAIGGIALQIEKLEYVLNQVNIDVGEAEALYDVDMLLKQVLTTDIEGAAENAHELGWKKVKDDALADSNNPFIGWGQERIRVTAEMKDIETREEMMEFLSQKSGIPKEDVAERLTKVKFAAIKNAKEGQDITHPLYMPYRKMLRQQPDGGVRMAGQNAMPLLILTLYLTDFRGDEIKTREGLQNVIQGLIDGTDKEGIAVLSRLNHIAFEASQLPFGERGYQNKVPEMKVTGRVKIIQPRVDFVPFDTLWKDVQALDSYTLLPAAQWLAEKVKNKFIQRNAASESL